MHHELKCLHTRQMMRFISITERLVSINNKLMTTQPIYSKMQKATFMSFNPKVNLSYEYFNRLFKEKMFHKVTFPFIFN